MRGSGVKGHGGFERFSGFSVLLATCFSLQHSFTLLVSLRCLRRVSFIYVSWKMFPMRCNPFCRPLPCLIVLYLYYLYFQLFGSFSRVVLLFFYFSLWRQAPARVTRGTAGQSTVCLGFVVTRTVLSSPVLLVVSPVCFPAAKTSQGKRL